MVYILAVGCIFGLIALIKSINEIIKHHKNNWL